MAATSAVMQSSIMASPVTRLHSKTGLTQIKGLSYFPRRHRGAVLRIKCTAEDGQMEEISSGAAPTPTPTPASPIPPPPKPSPAKMSTNFVDILAFNGPAPERINGRLAMIGFVSAMLVEVNKGGDVFTQISNGGSTWFLGYTIVLTLASLIPFFKGVSVQRVNDGIMTPDAEIWNGRLAMLGLVALAVTEYVKGSALVEL